MIMHTNLYFEIQFSKKKFFMHLWVVNCLLKSFGLVWTSMNTYCLEFQENIECNFPLIGGQDYYLYTYQVSSISNKIVFQIFDTIECYYNLKLDIKQTKNKKTDRLILIEPHLNFWHVLLQRKMAKLFQKKICYLNSLDHDEFWYWLWIAQWMSMIESNLGSHKASCCLTKA